MCPPVVAVAMFAVMAASAVMAHQAQSQAAKDQNNYAQREGELASENARRQYSDVLARQTQEQAAATQQKEQINLEARQQTATMATAAGEAGVSGLSVDSLLGDAWGTAAKKRDVVGTNMDWTVSQLQREQLGVQASATDRIAQARTARGPSGLSLGLGIAQAGLSSYGGYLGMTRGTNPTKTVT